MRRSTIVVAVFAATIASAGAAPVNERLARGVGVQIKTENLKDKTSAVPVVSKQNVNTLGRLVASTGASKTPTRSAGRPTPSIRAVAAVPAPHVTPKPVAAPVKTASRNAASRRVAAVVHRKASNRVAVRRLVGKSRTVSLDRKGASPSPEPGPVVAAAPTGSIPAMVTAEAQRAGVNPALAHAVVKVESRYQPNATGSGGYVGLMQLSYQTARGMGFRGSRQALYQPSNNLTYGMRYLAQAVKLAGGSTCGAVSKYQGGHGVRGVTRAGAVYCGKVRRFMAEGYASGPRASAN